MNYTSKCPNCGSSMVFSPEKQKLFCEHCETEVKPSDTSVHKDGEDINRCIVCGGNLEIPAPTTMAVSCPYCHSHNVIGTQAKGDYKPDVVIPFFISKRKAEDILRERLKKNKFGPGKRVLATSIEHLHGTYVPYWMFDFDAYGFGEYDCRTIRHHSDSEYDYTVTRYYNVMREVSVKYDKIPSDGLKAMDDQIYYDLEPYDYRALTPFEFNYLMGFKADRYDVNRQTGESIARGKMNKFVDEELRNTIHGYDTVIRIGGNIDATVTESNSALFPVWVTELRYNNKNFPIFINGQTGKVIGSFPKSKLKIGVTFAVTFLMCFILSGFFLY